MNLIAVSGGVDSMVLLDMYKNSNVTVVHINHNTRGVENQREEEMIREYCQKFNIPFYKADYFFDKSGNFHNEARIFRYSTFKNIANKVNAQKVLVAHHFDDQLENIFLFKEKVGYKLMKYEEELYGIVVQRPLLNMTKMEIYEYAKNHNVPFLEDSSNKEQNYKRNIIRNDLKKYTTDEKRKMYEIENEYEKYVHQLFLQYDLDQLRLDNIEEIYVFLKKNKIKSNISYKKLMLIKNFLRNGKNGEIFIDKNNKLVLNYGKIDIIDININILEENKKILLKKGENKFYSFVFFNENYNGYIRVPKVDDKIILKNGKKKLSRFFIDEKIERKYRKYWPVIVNSNDEVIKVLRKREVIIKE